jgi:hypothetical protein
MDKSKHTVAVPRDYLEMLEEFFMERSHSEKNIEGKVMNVSSPATPSGSSPILFITDEGFKVDGVIIVDKSGNEISRFTRTLYR